MPKKLGGESQKQVVGSTMPKAKVNSKMGDQHFRNGVQRLPKSSQTIDENSPVERHDKKVG